MIKLTKPKIQKATKITGNTLVFRNADVTDASFILALRTDKKKSRYLSVTPPDLEKQKAWLLEYERIKDQAYFIIQYQNRAIGTVRLYDPRGISFSWGSWILIDERPHQAAMESSLMVYSYALDHLGFKASHFDVRKGNERVWQFHERFGAKRVGQTVLDYLYEIDFEAIQLSRSNYSRFLDNHLTVDFGD